MSANHDQLSAMMPAYASVDEWIAREALPLELESAASRNAVVEKIVMSLGSSVELLGFGEALHGSEETLVLRNQLFQRLVQMYGYSAIAIESSVARAHRVDEYVNGRGPATYAEIQDTGFGESFGRLEANRELVEWMRSYNADPSHPVKLRFYGLDIPTGTAGIASPEQVLHAATDYLASIDSASAQAHRQQIDPLLGEDADWENPAAWADTKKAIGLSPAAAALRIATEDLITELRTRRPELVSRSSRERYLDALHSATVARQLLNMHAAIARKSGEPPAGPRGVRDALMADNLAYFVERERGRGKVFAFAHNGHLQRGKSVWPCCGQKFAAAEVFSWWPAGSQLDQMLGTRYAVIGSAVGVSADNGIAAPEAGSLEARFAAVPGAALAIPTQKGKSVPAAQPSALPVRSGSMKNLTYTALTPQSFTDFDWLIFLESTRYNRGGPVLQDWDSSAWDSNSDWGADSTDKKP